MAVKKKFRDHFEERFVNLAPDDDLNRGRICNTN